MQRFDDTSQTSRAPWRRGRGASALLAAAILVAGLATEGLRWSKAAAPHAGPEQASAAPGPAAGKVKLRERSSTLITMPAGVPAAHASALAVLPGGQMLAFWFAGSRESGPDVQVYASRWSNGNWGPAQPVASRASLAAALGFGVRRIGNPTAWTASDGKVHLFVVATGLGGWAASRVVHLVSSDLGASYEVRRVLPLSPLFNTSVLVRTAPLGLADGGWWLPLHFELGTKYPMIMAFDPRGEPHRLVRIGERTTVLQPSLVAVSPTEIRAWMRDISGQRRAQQAVSHDGGASWEDLPASELVNENNSLAALKLRQGGFVLVHNAAGDGNGSRSVLRLSVSSDARQWSPAFDVVAGTDSEEFSYPSVQQVGDQLHVTYTHLRRAIAHRVYDIHYEEGSL